MSKDAKRMRGFSSGVHSTARKVTCRRCDNDSVGGLWQKQAKGGLYAHGQEHTEQEQESPTLYSSEGGCSAVRFCIVSTSLPGQEGPASKLTTIRNMQDNVEKVTHAHSERSEGNDWICLCYCVLEDHNIASCGTQLV